MDVTNSTPAVNDEEKKIVIDIARSDTACVMDASNGFMQADAFKRVQALVAETCGRLGSFCEKIGNGICDANSISTYPRFHDTIFVDGERGAGKTSFLLTAIEKLCNHKFDDEKIKNKTRDNLKNIKFCSLSVIDPTLITSKNNLFILVIARIKGVVEEKRKERQTTCDSDDKYRDWNESLKSLARGLCMLDQVGGRPLEKDEWADAQYVLFKGLDDATGGLELERAFHKFVYKSLEFIGKDSFVLGFDDVDTDFAKGYEIMEVLRKYITTPQIVVLMAANYSLLYDMAVQKFWDSFKNNNFIESRGKKELCCQVEAVVSQYLKKIFNPERRIALKTPIEMKNLLFIKVKKIEGITDEQIKLVSFFQALIAIWFRLPYGVCRYIGEFFFKLPTRSLVMLISALQKKESVYDVMVLLANKIHLEEGTLVNSKNGGNKEKSSIKYDKLIQCHSVAFSDNKFFDVFSQILYVYQEELLSMGYGIDDLRNMFDKFKMYKVGKHLFDKKLLGTCAALMPKDASRVSDGDVFLLYQLVYGGFVAEIKNVFEYIVRILMLRDMVAVVGYKSIEMKNLVSNYYNEQSSAFDLCDNFVKILLSNNGIDNRFFVEIDNLNEKMLVSNVFNFVCFKYCEHSDYTASKKTYFSVYHFFAFLLFCCETSGDIVYALEQYSSIRTFCKQQVSSNGSDIYIKSDYVSIYETAKDGKESVYSELSSLIGRYSNFDDKNPSRRWEVSCPPYVLFNAYAKLDSKEFSKNANCDFKDVFKNVSNEFIRCLEFEEKHYREISAKLWKEQKTEPTEEKYADLHSFLGEIRSLINEILNSVASDRSKDGEADTPKKG